MIVVTIKEGVLFAKHPQSTLCASANTRDSSLVKAMSLDAVMIQTLVVLLMRLRVCACQKLAVKKLMVTAVLMEPSLQQPFLLSEQIV